MKSIELSANGMSEFSRAGFDFSDRHIRAPLHRWLTVQYKDQSETEIIHELKIPRPSARIDIAVVNGEFIGFEIKGDRDTLSRLPRQLRAYNGVFDRVYLVTTERHADEARLLVPEWWGLVLLTEQRSFRYARKAKLNRSVRVSALLHMLHRAELVSIFNRCQLEANIHSLKREELIVRIVKHVSVTKIKSEARLMLRLRSTGVMASTFSQEQFGDAGGYSLVQRSKNALSQLLQYFLSRLRG